MGQKRCQWGKVSKVYQWLIWNILHPKLGGGELGGGGAVHGAVHVPLGVRPGQVDVPHRPLAVHQGPRVLCSHPRGSHLWWSFVCRWILIQGGLVNKIKSIITYMIGRDSEELSKFPHFTPELFFYILLPPIILESAYSLHNKVFFVNIGPVLMYAVVGTTLNFILIGSLLILVQYMRKIILQDNDYGDQPTPSQVLLFASLISAVGKNVEILCMNQILLPIHFRPSCSVGYIWRNWGQSNVVLFGIWRIFTQWRDSGCVLLNDEYIHANWIRWRRRYLVPNYSWNLYILYNCLRWTFNWCNLWLHFCHCYKIYGTVANCGASCDFRDLVHVVSGGGHVRVVGHHQSHWMRTHPGSLRLQEHLFFVSDNGGACHWDTQQLEWLHHFPLLGDGSLSLSAMGYMVHTLESPHLLHRQIPRCLHPHHVHRQEHWRQISVHHGLRWPPRSCRLLSRLHDISGDCSRSSDVCDNNTRRHCLYCICTGRINQVVSKVLDMLVSDYSFHLDT